MLTVVEKLSPNTVQALRDLLETGVAPHLVPDVSNYAQGRMRAWFPYEAPLSAARPWAQGIQVDGLLECISLITSSYDFVPELGLASRGGAIARHRDASYAEFRAFGINIGQATFHYENIYQDFKWQPNTPERAEPMEFHFSGGEVFEFCCKNPHWVTDVAPDRWGLNLWRVSGKERRRFQSFIGGKSTQVKF